MNEHDEMVRHKKYVDDKTVNFSALHERNEPFFDSLLDQYTDTAMKPMHDQEELIRENERNFIEGASVSVYGPIKYMSKEQIS